MGLLLLIRLLILLIRLLILLIRLLILQRTNATGWVRKSGKRSRTSATGSERSAEKSGKRSRESGNPSRKSLRFDRALSVGSFNFAVTISFEEIMSHDS